MVYDERADAFLMSTYACMANSRGSLKHAICVTRNGSFQLS